MVYYQKFYPISQKKNQSFTRAFCNIYSVKIGNWYTKLPNGTWWGGLVVQTFESITSRHVVAHVSRRSPLWQSEFKSSSCHLAPNNSSILSTSEIHVRCCARDSKRQEIRALYSKLLRSTHELLTDCLTTVSEQSQNGVGACYWLCQQSEHSSTSLNAP